MTTVHFELDELDKKLTDRNTESQLEAEGLHRVIPSEIGARSKQKIGVGTMKQKILVSFAALLGIIAIGVFSPLNAQQEIGSESMANCAVGQVSGAACSGEWVVFAGNTSGVDSGAWVVRMNSETGEVWYKSGKRFVLLEEPN